jgi:low temperature requirement protein LtrA
MVATAVDHEHSVTPRELFFDLVFVFAFTQVTTLLAHDPTFAGIGRGVLVLAALWWPWTAYAWLTNTVDPEEGFVGAALLVALIAMFLAALAVPHVFGDDGVLFGAAFLVVVAMHLSLYALAGRGNPDLLAAVLRLAPWTLIGAALILLAGFLGGARTWLWVAALACTYGGAGLAGSTGWRIHPSHLTERYGLVLIIALGEAFVAIGIGATGVGIGAREVVAAILGLLIATAFWLAYFDFFSIRGAQMLASREGPRRVALARDLYAYGHLPMIVGVVLFAFAMKTIVAHVGEQLDWVAAFALCGGSALYLLTYSAVRSVLARRLSLSRGRFAAAVGMLLVLPAGHGRPGARRARARDRRLGGAARVRARLVARGARRVAVDARLVVREMIVA